LGATILKRVKLSTTPEAVHITSSMRTYETALSLRLCSQKPLLTSFQQDLQVTDRLQRRAIEVIEINSQNPRQPINYLKNESV